MNQSKYHNRKVQYDGLSFDSAKECRRYKELKLLERAGRISQLETQVKLIIVPAQTAPDGKRLQPITYVADFCYLDEFGRTTVEDVKPDGLNRKGNQYKTTPAWRTYYNKKKALYYRTGIWIREV